MLLLPRTVPPPPAQLLRTKSRRVNTQTDMKISLSSSLLTSSQESEINILPL